MSEFYRALDSASDLYLEEVTDHSTSQALRNLEKFAADNEITCVSVDHNDGNVIINTNRYEIKLKPVSVSIDDKDIHEDEEDDDTQDPIDAAEDIAGEYSDMDSTQQRKFDKLSGGAGSKSTKIVRDYGKTAVLGASKTLDTLKKVMNNIR